MDTGQITQGLRAQVMQQAEAQGINVDKMMESGISFMDIMQMIISNTKNAQDGSGIIQEPVMENGQEGGLFGGAADTLIEFAAGLSVPADLASGAVEMSDVSEEFENLDSDKPLNGFENEVIFSFDEPEEENLVENELPRYDVERSFVSFKNNHNIRTIDDMKHFQQFNGGWKLSSFAQEDDTAEMPVSTDALHQQMEEVVSAIEPELEKFSDEITVQGFDSARKFTDDLIKEINKIDDVQDSFDFSENIVRIDPMQLAGLLDFIRTGNAIPIASDVSDSAVFKTQGTVSGITEKALFDPEELIKSGEMEIVSYVPASKEPDTPKQDMGQDSEDTIDFARVMKNVRENVGPVKEADDGFDAAFERKYGGRIKNVESVNNSETSENSGILKTDEKKTAYRPAAESTQTEKNVSETTSPESFSSSLNAENLMDRIHRVDISFERAYAELEMNKAKYGSPDQQLAKGIAENLQKGKSEFTVKLRPEGLGEILVKLVSDEAGRSVLSIVASSEKTADLLNRDLASLQASLSDHNVHIENNSVKTAETVMPAQSGFDQYDERRQQEAEQQNHFRHLRQKLHKDDEISASGTAYEQEISVSGISDDSALNIKI